jgi:HD-GYP domain-containing protein (c-di-GMP phosphodiesterase class II)
MSTMKRANQTTAQDGLSDRIRQAGMLLIRCDMDGVMPSPRRDGDWLSSLIEQPAVVRAGLRGAAKQWFERTEPVPCDGIPGLWFIPMPVEERRSRTGYDVVCVPCASLLASEQFRLLCQAASIDAEYARGAFAALPPTAETEVRRIAMLLRGTWNDVQRCRDSEHALEDVGRELAESYEEINLLYSITRNMTEVECPEHFLEVTCRELRQQLPYEWVAAIVQDEQGDPTLQRGRVALAGDADRTMPELRSLAQALLLRAQPGRPIIIDSELAASEPSLSDSAIAQPIVRDGRVIGLLIAAGKQGSDQDASSVDIKLVTAAASHIEIFLENAGLYEDLNAMFLGTLESLTASIDAKDKYTCGHSRRVALLTKQLAAASGCDANTLHRMHIAGLVHDVGKIGVPERVLVKPGDLDAEEFNWIRRHPEIGHRILRDIPHFDDVLAGVRHHHERWDGQGYPAGTAGADIPLVARMIAIADAFDAMTSSRTYREGMSRETVLAEMQRCAGTQFDPTLVPIFVSLDFTEYDRMVAEHTTAEQQSIVVQERAA